MTTSIDIVRAVAGDGPLLARLNEPVQRAHAAHEDSFVADPDPADVASFFEAFIERAGHVVDIASIGGEPAGYLAYEVREPVRVVFKHPAPTVYIHQVATLARFQRRGVGRALFAAVEEVARARGIGHLTLDTYAFNRDAQRVFRSLGFATTKIEMRRRL